MKKFIHTKQRKAELAATIRGYNYKIRRAAALKAHGKYEGVVLPKLLNSEKEFTKIKVFTINFITVKPFKKNKTLRLQVRDSNLHISFDF